MRWWRCRCIEQQQPPLTLSPASASTARGWRGRFASSVALFMLSPTPAQITHPPTPYLVEVDEQVAVLAKRGRLRHNRLELVSQILKVDLLVRKEPLQVGVCHVGRDGCHGVEKHRHNLAQVVLGGKGGGGELVSESPPLLTNPPHNSRRWARCLTLGSSEMPSSMVSIQTLIMSRICGMGRKRQSAG